MKMAYLILAILTMMVIGGALAVLGAVGYVAYQKIICGSEKSFWELFGEF